MSRLEFTLNGRASATAAEPATLLIDLLRGTLGLTGTHQGCDTAQCGACTVLLDGKPVQSCDTPLWSAPGHEITTIEGLGSAEEPGRLQQAFIDEQAMQCGYCINGIIMSAEALLTSEPAPTDAGIAQALERNLCRCGTHLRVLRAIKRAAGAEK